MAPTNFLLRVGIAALAVTWSCGVLRAGDDGPAVRPTSLSPSAEIDRYLEEQKIAHAVESTGGDGKGESALALTVKIYGVSADAQQNAICTALGTTARKDHVRETTVLFYLAAATSAAQQTVFVPSQLPSGNGEVEFPRDPRPSVGYQLQRTVKL